MGIFAEEIQVRLIENNNGLTKQQDSIYSWTKEIYGVTYSEDSNVERNLVIDELISGSSYVFKYFCVDQTGKSSGGKITLFDTPASDYSLAKIIL